MDPMIISIFFVILGIGLIGIFIIAASTFLLYRQIKHDNEWRRRKWSHDSLQQITSDRFQTAMSHIRQTYKNNIGLDIQDRSKNYLDLKCTLATNSSLKREVNTSVIYVINVLESIAVMVKNQIADEDIVYNFTYTFVIDFYYWVSPYILECRQMESNEFILAELEFYALRWEERLKADKQKNRESKAEIVRPKGKLGK